jgi:hypothetical protein
MSKEINLIRNITIIPWELFCFHVFPGKITDSFRENSTKVKFNGVSGDCLICGIFFGGTRGREISSLHRNK